MATKNKTTAAPPPGQISGHGPGFWAAVLIHATAAGETEKASEARETLRRLGWSVRPVRPSTKRRATA